MPSFEASRACTHTEYEKSKDDRFAPEQVVVEEDYTLMLLPFKGYGEADAYAVPVRCLDGARSYRKPGLWTVKLTGLDEDMQPVEDNYLYLNSDGISVLTEEFVKQDPGIKESYLKSYDDGLDGELNLYLNLSRVSLR